MTIYASTFEFNPSVMAGKDQQQIQDDTGQLTGPGTAISGPGTAFHYAQRSEQTRNTSSEIPGRKNPEPKPQGNLDWVTGLLLFCLLLLAVMRFHYRKRLSQLFQAFFALNYANILSREAGLFKESYFLPGITLSLISVSLFVLQIFNFYELNIIAYESGALRYVIIFATLLGLWLLKALLVNISGFIFNTRETSRDYNYNMQIFFIVNGILLLPVVIIISYRPSGLFFTFGLILLSVVFLFWLFRAFTVGMREKVFSGFHLFLYICTFELLPVITIAKFVFSLVN
ncbi:MAG: DUF4271 domain-containing protein [Bacteroidales bacterium]|nr:DUF4271 domain-containing protein [Bacteroidales bacterium]MCF8344164.1 DUF4271 domain-containing protein [Bacteroidales bacterium]MCF8351127.1 DUF4271 domain-containing protein [Bacteroidales bacterium]MCF8374811.1 DUF4271 domain-containing protein [Bacteroidales bacterium]MCF8399785.1 DUF4271 domain-containing protein [Bacteroidales bacterium]